MQYMYICITTYTSIFSFCFVFFVCLLFLTLILRFFPVILFGGLFNTLEIMFVIFDKRPLVIIYSLITKIQLLQFFDVNPQ